MSEPRRAVVVGGGLAGLTAAWQLEQDDPDVQVVVVEATERTGGKLHAADLLGRRVDRGADAFLVRVPAALELCEELGLQDELVQPQQRDAYVVHNATLVKLPEGLVLGVPTDLDALRASGLVSEAAVARAAQDLDAPDDRPEGDETVGAFVRRRLGDEIFEVLVEPLLSGINAGSADELSVQAGAAQLAAAVREQPSLIAGARSQRAAAAARDQPVFNSLRGGAGALPQALRDALRGEVRTGVRATSLERSDTGWRVRTALEPARLSEADRAPVVADTVESDIDSVGPDTDGELLEADAVVLAVPAFAAAPLLTPRAPGTAAQLAALRYASVAVVLAVWDRAQVGHALEASGVLVPAREGMLTTACSFGSSKWPHWSDRDTVVLRASVGRLHDERHIAMGDDDLAREVLDELRPLLGLSGTPRALEVVRWDRALPQYEPGHLDRVAAWEVELAERAPGVVLCGAATRGLGIPAVIAEARTAARRLSPERRA